MAHPTKCPRQHCGARLRFTTNSFGGTIAVCDPCARNRAGQCRDCTRRLDAPTAMRCPACAAARVLANQRARYNAPDSRQRKNALAYAKRPDVLARQRVRAAARQAAAVDARLARSRADYRKHRLARAAQKRQRYATDAKYRARMKAAARADHAARRDAIAQRKRDDHAAFRARFGYFPGRCQQCGASIPYAGKGGKRMWCEAHRPYRVRIRERAKVAA